MAHAFGYLKGCAWIVAALLALAGAWAQTAPSGQLVRFSVFSAQPIKDIAFAPRANAAPQKVQFHSTARSTRLEYRGAMPIRFVDTTTGEVVAEATVPPDIRDALLLFSPAPASSAKDKKALRYQIAVLDDSGLRHGAGSLAIINLSGLALSGTVGKEKVSLKAGLNPTLAIGRSAPIAFQTSVKDRTYQAFASTVQLGPRQRALLILFPPYYRGSHEVQSRLLIDEPPAGAPR